MENEKRPIDANALTDVIEHIDWYHIGVNGKLAEGANPEHNIPLFKADDIYEALENAPTVDAVEVVRCEKCKHLNVLNREDIYAHCPKTNTVFLPFELDTRTHFCSYGERKDNES